MLNILSDPLSGCPLIRRGHRTHRTGAGRLNAQKYIRPGMSHLAIIRAYFSQCQVILIKKQKKIPVSHAGPGAGSKLRDPLLLRDNQDIGPVFAVFQKFFHHIVFYAHASGRVPSVIAFAVQEDRGSPSENDRIPVKPDRHGIYVLVIVNQMFPLIPDALSTHVLYVESLSEDQ